MVQSERCRRRRRRRPSTMMISFRELLASVFSPNAASTASNSICVRGRSRAKRAHTSCKKRERECSFVAFPIRLESVSAKQFSFRNSRACESHKTLSLSLCSSLARSLSRARVPYPCPLLSCSRPRPSPRPATSRPSRKPTEDKLRPWQPARLRCRLPI